MTLNPLWDLKGFFSLSLFFPAWHRPIKHSSLNSHSLSSSLSILLFRQTYLVAPPTPSTSLHQRAPVRIRCTPCAAQTYGNMHRGKWCCWICAAIFNDGGNCGCSSSVSLLLLCPCSHTLRTLLRSCLCVLLSGGVDWLALSILQTALWMFTADCFSAVLVQMTELGCSRRHRSPLRKTYS